MKKIIVILSILALVCWIEPRIIGYLVVLWLFMVAGMFIYSLNKHSGV